MFSLRCRRLSVYMIEVFKMIHGINKVNLELFCIDEDGRKRKHSICLKIRRDINSKIELNLFNVN